MRWHRPLKLFLLAILSCLPGGFLNDARCARAPQAQPAERPITLSPRPRAQPGDPQTVVIPGPLIAFLRMAGISQQVAAEDVLPLLARNTMAAWHDGKPSAYLTLLRQYVEQARQMAALAGASGVIEVRDCNEAKALVSLLGYRFREACGANAALETADGARAFLTVDSGFPVSDLEEAIRAGKTFHYSFPMSPVPLLFSEADWTALVNGDKDRPTATNVVDALLSSPSVSRLYWSLSRMDRETQAAIEKSPGLDALLPLVASLDFYGGQISVRGGRVMVPGGTAAEGAWERLAGASVTEPGIFVRELLGKDSGALAAYFDAASRAPRAQQAYFCDPSRLPQFYEAFRRADKLTPLAESVFVPYPGLLILMTRLQLDENGQPRVPGGVTAWRQIGRSGLRGGAHVDSPEEWTAPERVVQAMVGYSRAFPEEGLLPLFLSLNEVDRNRRENERLSAATAQTMGANFRRFHSYYPIFAEFGALDDRAVGRFFAAADAVERIHSRELRADALGIFQADVGLWQILARQGEISRQNWNGSWQKLLEPFGPMNTAAQLFDAGRASLGEIMKASSGKTEVPYGQFLALLAGPEQHSPEGQAIRNQLTERIRTVMHDQQLISFDALFQISDGIQGKVPGGATSGLILQRAAELPGFELPRALLSGGEREQFFSGPFNDRHALVELKIDLVKALKNSRGSERLLENARGELTPFLRDTLVGLNYAYYEPPGSQVLHHDALFVRSHDFAPETANGNSMDWETPQLSGKGRTAMGSARLIGSLADLPYVLADVEQNFLVPQNAQALIWEALVPSILTSGTVPRWWAVTPDELHGVALYQRAGEELVSASARDAKLRTTVLEILSERVPPRIAERLEQALAAGHGEEALAQVTPAESFDLAAEFRSRNPGSEAWGPAGRELEALARRNPGATEVEKLSADFGATHPGLTRSYGRELVNAEIFPAYASYSSQLLAESWESNNLYWARLADEKGYAPVLLNRLVPQLTLQMAEDISASHFDDWPALLRAMRATGQRFRTMKTERSESRETAAAN